MEVEVKSVAGLEGCYVSLPLHLIQTLQSTTTNLFSFLALELRSVANNHLFWFVAWSGSASSSSSAIEISQKYAECINLPDHTVVRIRVVSNVPNAVSVTVEPDTEDDWEVLELNAEHAEAAILKQAGIVHEGMRLPLWLHGHTATTFSVVSTDPKEPVVKLAPQTEVFVAPKRRRRAENSVVKALLRVQDEDNRFFHKCRVNDPEMGVVLTSAVFIHSETAEMFSLDSLQPVVLEQKLVLKEKKSNLESWAPSKNGKSTAKEAENGTLTDKNDIRQAVVRLLISDSVAKGHVMLSRSLRYYLRADLHSWIHVKNCNPILQKDPPSFVLSPCQFKMFGKKGSETGGFKTDKMFLKTKSDTQFELTDRSTHERIMALISDVSPSHQDEETSISKTKTGILLLRAWILAQLDAIISFSKPELNSMVLGNKTLIHFQIKSTELTKRLKAHHVKKRDGESLVDIMYVLSVYEEFMQGVTAFELEFFDDISKSKNQRSLEFFLEKLHLGEELPLYSVKERISDKRSDMKISSLSWMGTTATDVTNRLMVLLSPSSGIFLTTYNLPFPGHVLIYGPPGSGKTLLATTVAKTIEEHEDILAHIVYVGCSRLVTSKPQAINQALSSYISEALDHAPSLVVLDDLDSIITSSNNPEDSHSSSSSTLLMEFLTGILDEYEEKRKSSCGIGPVAFIACVQTLTSIPQALSSSGRFDFHVQLAAPAAAERGALLKHEIEKRSLLCSDDILLDIASSCDGYDAYDLEILVDRAVHAAIGRFVPQGFSSGTDKKPTLAKDDFLVAMKGFLPIAMRDITKSASDEGHGGWQDVGGLTEIRNSIKEMIELPSKFPTIFSQAPLRMRSNVLLYGPPGCGKTHIVGAAAAACSLRFISVKGPELLNKYIGASEQAVRDIFSKAAAAAPCLLFFDEFDSIAPKRGHDNTGVTDRVVNQFLTELDGVEVLTGVFVFAATSRPDLLDAALLRPGRLDRLLFCDFPSPKERLDILTVLSRKLPLANDVNMESIARKTEGFSGADLQALLSDAQLAAVHDHLNSKDVHEPGYMPVITNATLRSIASNVRPSVSEAEKQRLYSIYGQFLDAKRSTSAQSRDAKGKRATLA
ncbi:peroxisomal ATPase PEX1 [Rutidosis leptorrhynchoides]|uniref:peroxisomal ATPase PEX1 n=1 Tax=Rutidosis leptorrhynchoides TaxID=125765 RepID=UPI003A99A2FD